MSEPSLLIDHRGTSGWITLNRPERLNAMDPDMREELHRYLDEVAESPTVRVVVLQGAGRAFCSGLDLKTGFDLGAPVTTASAERLLAFQRRWSQLTVKLRRLPQPVVALVRGPAAGLGFSLALAADIRIASRSASFSAAFIKIGFSGGDCGSSYHLPRIVGGAAARELLLTGRPCSADRALQLGMVSEVVAEDQLETAGRALVDDLLSTGTTGLRMTKDLLNAAEAGGGLEDHLALEDRNQMYCYLSGEPAEGMRAFLERRAPRFGPAAG